MILQLEMWVATSSHYRRFLTGFWHAASGFSGKLGDNLLITRESPALLKSVEPGCWPYRS